MKISEETKKSFALQLIESVNNLFNQAFVFEQKQNILRYIRDLSNAQTKVLFDDISKYFTTIERGQIAKFFHNSIVPYLSIEFNIDELLLIKKSCNEEAILTVVDLMEDTNLELEDLVIECRKRVYSLNDIDTKCNELSYNAKQIRDFITTNVTSYVKEEMDVKRINMWKFELDLVPKTQKVVLFEDFMIENQNE